MFAERLKEARKAKRYSQAEVSLLLGGVMVSAAASGTMPLWAALLGLFAAVVMLNAACGILLGTPAAEPRRAVPARTSRPAGGTPLPRACKICA